MKYIAAVRRTAVLAILVAVITLPAATDVAVAQIPRRVRQSVRPPDLNVQFHRAETAWKSGNSLLEAKARIDRVLHELPDDVEARKLRAGIFLSMNRPGQALNDARHAAHLSDADGEAHLLVCEAAARTGETETATAALHRAAGLLIDRPDLHVRLSQCAAELGLLDEAEAYGRIALAANDAGAAAYLQLARVFAIARQIRKSATVLERGLRLGFVRPDQIRADSVFHEVMEDDRLAPLMNGR